MSVDFTDKTVTLERAKQLSDQPDVGPKDDYVDELLVQSAGTLGALTIYRPYWTAAMTLHTTTFRVEKAPEADFRPVIEQIKALLRLQWAADTTLGTKVPPGYEATFEAFGLAGKRIGPSFALRNQPVY